jgi:hypothetical protein
MQKGLPDIVTKESEQGDRLHDYSAHPEYERKLLSPEEQDLLRIADWLEKQAFDAIGIKGASYIEKREAEMQDGSLSGHPDLMRIYGHGLLDTPRDSVTVITDRKFGWAPVARADVNLQMRVYALLATTPDVYVSILQPRAALADRVTIAKYNPDNKTDARWEIDAIVKATEAPDAPLVAGEEQCRYCRARAICPALREAISKELVVFDDDMSPELSKRAKLSRVEARLAQAKDEQLGALLSACALARLVNDPLGDEIRSRIAAGQMEGYTVGKESEVRVITNVRKAVSLIVLNRMLPRDRVLERCELSIGGIEEEYRKATKVSEKQAKADVNKVLADVIVIENRRGRILKK